ncbi:2-oxoglutarate and iron-dependent oxygenase domain-containing protein [Komagataeibacter rhaeticus]|nr:2-oxoglutarate and iron-dependent oxygenase domain-containing protein [Komagataeibacter rhaeticus]
MPFIYINVSTSLRSFDPSWELAARSLGASPIVTFYRVTMPLMKSGLTSGCLFGFIVSFDAFSTSFLLKDVGTATLPIQLFDYLRLNFTPEAAAVSTFSIIVTFLIVIMTKQYLESASPNNPYPDTEQYWNTYSLHHINGRMDMTAQHDFPLVNLHEFETTSSTGRLEYGSRVDTICRRSGFLAITGHGVPADLIETMWDETRKFFDLPLEQKLKARPGSRATPMVILQSKARHWHDPAPAWMAAPAARPEGKLQLRPDPSPDRA